MEKSDPHRHIPPRACSNFSPLACCIPQFSHLFQTTVQAAGSWRARTTAVAASKQAMLGLCSSRALQSCHWMWLLAIPSWSSQALMVPVRAAAQLRNGFFLAFMSLSHSHKCFYSRSVLYSLSLTNYCYFWPYWNTHMIILLLYSDWRVLSSLNPWKVSRRWATAISKAGFTWTAFLHPAHRTSWALLQATHNSLGAFSALAWLFSLVGGPIEKRPIQNWKSHLFFKETELRGQSHDMTCEEMAGKEPKHLIYHCEEHHWSIVITQDESIAEICTNIVALFL